MIAGCGAKVSQPGGAHDVGPVFTSKTKTVTHTFRVVNTTGVAVRVVDEMHGCLCTTVKLEKGTTLATGAEMPLTLTVSAVSAHPDQTVECTIVTDHPTMPQWTYRLTLHPFPDAILKPDRIDLGKFSDFDPASAASSPEPSAYLEVYGELASRPRPEIDRASLHGASVRFGEASGREMLASGVARVRYPIFVEPPNPCEDGRHQSTLNFRGDGSPLLSTSISWEKVGPLSVAPSQLYFGLFTTGRSSDPLQVRVTASGGRTFGITEIESSSKFVTTKLSDPSTPARSHHLSVTFQAPTTATDRAVTGHILIKTDLDGGVAVKVPYSAFLLPPEREAKKDSLDQSPTREE